jgi:hypothetical protein
MILTYEQSNVIKRKITFTNLHLQKQTTTRMKRRMPMTMMINIHLIFYYNLRNHILGYTNLHGGAATDVRHYVFSLHLFSIFQTNEGYTIIKTQTIFICSLPIKREFYCEQVDANKCTREYLVFVRISTPYHVHKPDIPSLQILQ